MVELAMKETRASDRADFDFVSYPSGAIAGDLFLGELVTQGEFLSLVPKNEVTGLLAVLFKTGGRSRLAERAPGLGYKYTSPFDFVDFCERVRDTGTPDENLAQRVQNLEWQLLFDHCFELAEPTIHA